MNTVLNIFPLAHLVLYTSHLKFLTNFWAENELDQVAVPPAVTEAKDYWGLKLLSRYHDVANNREFQVFESDDLASLMTVYDGFELNGVDVTRFPVIDDSERQELAKKKVTDE